MRAVNEGRGWWQLCYELAVLLGLHIKNSVTFRVAFVMAAWGLIQLVLTLAFKRRTTEFLRDAGI